MVTVRDITMNADVFRAAYPHWPHPEPDRKEDHVPDLDLIPEDLRGPGPIQLDVALDDGETVHDAIAVLTFGLPCTTGRVITEHGPAGGWPLVEFAGPEPELDTLRQRYFAE